MGGGSTGAYRLRLVAGSPGEPLVLDPSTIWPSLLADLREGRATGEISWRFHQGLVNACIAVAQRLRGDHATGFGSIVALSGGSFQNAFLLRALRAGLARCGWRVLTHGRLPPNDGGLAVGQAAIAAAKQEGSSSPCAWVSPAGSSRSSTSTPS
jgi:hydrogenase maturation protein HypF